MGFEELVDALKVLNEEDPYLNLRKDKFGQVIISLIPSS